MIKQWMAILMLLIHQWSKLKMINFLWLFPQEKINRAIFSMPCSNYKWKNRIISDIKLALSPSKPGYFDSEGLLNCCLLNIKTIIIFIILAGKIFKLVYGIVILEDNCRSRKPNCKERIWWSNSWKR